MTYVCAHCAGRVSTFQIGTDLDYGALYKITPVTTETELNVMKCFQVNGTKEEPVLPQGALPDLEGFQVCAAFRFSEPVVTQMSEMRMSLCVCSLRRSNITQVFYVRSGKIPRWLAIRRALIAYG